MHLDSSPCHSTGTGAHLAKGWGAWSTPLVVTAGVCTLCGLLSLIVEQELVLHRDYQLVRRFRPENGELINSSTNGSISRSVFTIRLAFYAKKPGEHPFARGIVQFATSFNDFVRPFAQRTARSSIPGGLHLFVTQFRNPPHGFAKRSGEIIIASRRFDKSSP